MTETILITGANRGIGLELARCFARSDWQVLACCRQPEAAAALAALEREYPQLVMLPLDVTDAGQISALARELGGRPIDILLNNAGIWGPKDQGFGELDEAWWMETLRVNTVAPLKICEALVENVVASHRKLMASMGSQLGCLGENSSGDWYIYRSSKAALHMAMRSLAVDLAPRGVTSVMLHPGWVRTRMGGETAPLQPQESAAGLHQVLLERTHADSGKLFNYRGELLAW